MDSKFPSLNIPILQREAKLNFLQCIFMVLEISNIKEQSKRRGQKADKVFKSFKKKLIVPLSSKLHFYRSQIFQKEKKKINLSNHKQ